MIRNFNFTDGGERVVAVRVEQTREADQPIAFQKSFGEKKTAVGDRHDVFIGDNRIGYIEHVAQEAEIGSMLVMVERWSAHLYDSLMSVGNILDEEDAIRSVVSLSEDSAW